AAARRARGLRGALTRGAATLPAGVASKPLVRGRSATAAASRGARSLGRGRHVRARGAVDRHARGSGQVISPEDRWRLILGTEREKLGEGTPLRAGLALDELYGEGLGEGSNTRLGGLGPGGFSTRQWSEELQNLFGVR